MKWINRLYIFFLGIILTITTGFGVAAFYPQPVSPSYPTMVYTAPIPESCNATPKGQSSRECQDLLAAQKNQLAADDQTRQEFETKMEKFQNVNAGYTRTAVFLGITIGAVFAVIGIAFIKKSKLVSTGLLLSSVLTAVLTRLLINLASLGNSVSGTAGADTLSFVEFGVLALLSVLVIIVGQLRLSDDTSIPRP
jgi:hypothetical protein